VEVVDREDGVRQQLADRAGVARVPVDHHYLHAGAERRAALLEPAGGGGPAVDLPQQALPAGLVDEPGQAVLEEPAPRGMGPLDLAQGCGKPRSLTGDPVPAPAGDAT